MAALALPSAFLADSLISLFSLPTIRSMNSLFLSPMTILVSYNPYSSLSSLYLSMLHAPITDNSR